MPCCGGRKKDVSVAKEDEGKEGGKIDTFESKQAPIFNFKNRRCPWFDWIMIPVFLAFWVGMFIVAGFGIYSGNPLTLINPVDYQQNICGYAKGAGRKDGNFVDLTNYTYLWFPFEFSTTDLKDISQAQIWDALNLGICVNSCPSSVAPSPYSVICTYDYNNLTLYDRYLRAVQGSGGCFFNLFETKSLANRCIPTLSENSTLAKLLTPSQQTVFKDVLYFTDGLKSGVNELYNSYCPILLSVALCMVLCFLSIIFIGVFIGVVAYLVVFAVWIVLAAAGGYSLYIGINKYTNLGDSDSTRIWLAVGGIILGCWVLYSFLFMWLWKRIRVAINVIRAATKAVIALPGLFMVPPIAFIFICVFGIYWFIVEAYLASSQKSYTINASQLTNNSYVATGLTDIQKAGAMINSNFTKGLGNSTITIGGSYLAMQILEAYHLFGILWVLAFISAFSYTVMAGAVGNWYFSAKGDKKSPPRFTVAASFARTIVFHTGSILIGSMIVAIVQFVRFLFQKLKKKALGKDKWAKYVIKIVEVLLCILEAIVKFVNKNAYIIIAIHGTGFCLSAKRGFQLVFTNILRFTAVNTVGEFILFLNQIIITLVCGIFTYAFIQLNNNYNWNIVSGVQYGIVPTIAAGFLAFCVSALTMQVYHVAIDTILMCFVYDIDIHSPDDYYMGGALRTLVSKDEKKQDPA
jgi:choline transporter-like protein 2/4/5